MDHDGLNFGNTPLNNQALEIESYSNTISFSAERIFRICFFSFYFGAVPLASDSWGCIFILPASAYSVCVHFL